MTESQGTHFWFISIQASRPGARPTTHSYSGTITPKPGETRYELYVQVLASMKEQHLIGFDCAAIAFDIQPNEL